MYWYIRFLPGWSGEEFKCTVQCCSAQTPINYFKTVMQSRQKALWAYCPNNIYTVISARLVLFGHDFSLNESSLSSAASVSPIPPLPTGLVIGRVPRGPRRPRPHSVAISASSSSSCGQLQYSPIRRKLQREKPREFFRVAESAVNCAVFEFF